jgi:hypothetical protein
MRTVWPVVVAVLLLPLVAISADDKTSAAKPPPQPKNNGFTDPPRGYKRQVMEGFVLWIHEDVLKHNEESTLRRKPLEVLELELKTIVRIMRPEAVKILRNLLIWVEWDDRIELGGNGRAVAVYVGGNQLAVFGEGRHPLKVNNITILSLNLLTREHQPPPDADLKDEKLDRCVLLHEMAHAVHHYYLGFDNPLVKETYKQAMERSLYNQAKDINDKVIPRPYASVNDHEYFAEISCAYLDRLYYFPFNRADLKSHDPLGYKLMEQVWGKTKEQLAQEKAAKSEKTKPPPATTQANQERPKPAPSNPAADDPDKDEKAAARKLKAAKAFVDDGKKDDAREYCEEILKKFPSSKAAEEAKELLQRLKK